MDEPWIGSDRLAATREGWDEKEAERQIFKWQKFDKVEASAGALDQESCMPTAIERLG